MRRLPGLPAGNLLTPCERHRENVIKVSFFRMAELNFLGDSRYLDLFFLWLSLVAGHSSGPLWFCLAFLVFSL